MHYYIETIFLFRFGNGTYVFTAVQSFHICSLVLHAYNVSLVDSLNLSRRIISDC